MYISSISQYMNNRLDLFEELIEYLQSGIYELNKLYNVTCIGIYNHGKSTLLNALVNSLDDSIFATSDKRETTESKAYQYGDILWTDTPGLNATKGDDNVTMKEVRKSHLNLFAHNLSTGGLNQQERKFLQEIARIWDNPKQFLDNTIFVLNNFGGQDENAIKDVEREITSQIQTIFGAEAKVDMLVVSAKNYQKGKQDNKQMLIKQSNIKQLYTMIQGKKEQFSKDDIMSRRLMKKLDIEIDKRKKELEECESDIKKIDRELINEISKANNKIKSYRQGEI
ncbi:hypothetical protein CQA53_00020 [Helicobacter didelphidarum]|uniref:G domain-containing protein n=1 Tax=Helicobacter didelphidarum TaxID=2040648 RepID=A0A3D8IRC3_9HELI|nr:GTPase [Helicobacter didelphidarum]RDU67455.1 hypothetical protein CQA53_00020 [Helicobacter didelphidarum]